MKNLLIIGLDGGASKVNGRVVEWNENNNSFSLKGPGFQKYYNEYPEYDPMFKSIDLQQQLSERGTIDCQSIIEKEQAKSYIKAFAEIIGNLRKSYTNEDIILGIGMPGLKSEDERGIEVIANGPRMPLFADELEFALKQKGITLASKIARLGSDADYCGIGEEYAEGGMFRDVQNAYYLGGGTGVADAMKLEGQIVPFDQAKDWLAKAWEMKAKNGLSMEQIVSARGIQKTYAQIASISLEKIDRERIFPSTILQFAIAGKKEAVECMNLISQNLAELVFERMQSVYEGWSGNFEFINSSKSLTRDHSFSGTFFDRIVIGQRLGDLMEEAKVGDHLYDPFIKVLSQLITTHKDEKFRNYYLPKKVLRKDLIRISCLRDAPALGAGIDAFFHFKSESSC